MRSQEPRFVCAYRATVGVVRGDGDTISLSDRLGGVGGCALGQPASSVFGPAALGIPRQRAVAMSNSNANGRSPAIAYVLTHYPKRAQTFIAGEIAAVEAAGQPIRVFAMNHPGSTACEITAYPAQVASTTYLKAGWLGGAASLAAFTLRHPAAMVGVWKRAIASGGTSPMRIAKRLAHLVEAAIVARAAMRDGIGRLHAHFGLAPASIAWLACRIMRAAGCRHAQFSFTIHGYHDFVDRAESRLDLKAAEAREVYCISAFTRSQLCLETDPRLWGKFEVMRCGIDTRAIAYRDPPPVAERPRLIAVGRLSPEKGLGVLLEALAFIRDQGRDFTLTLVGDGPQKHWIEERIDALSLQDRVSMTGELSPERVRAELQASDVFVMASFSEGLPVSIMEAMATGVPVVSTWIAGIPELCRDGETALTVPPADSLALANAILTLLEGSEMRLRLARAARRQVEVQHDLGRNGAALAERFGSATA